MNKDHHFWCNYGIGLVEDCSMCERLYRRFPIKEGRTSDDMMEEHFPDTTWRDFKIVDYGRVVFGRASKLTYKSKH